MVRLLRARVMWAVTFLCACSASVPRLPAQQPEAIVIRPHGYKPVDLTRQEFEQGMRMLYANGPLPGLPKGGKPRLLLASADPIHLARAAGYLQYCQHVTGKRMDCWDDLNEFGGLDNEGATFVALHFALAEALEDAAAAVKAMTPDQVRAMLSLMFLGMIVELLSPEPVTKVLFMLSMTNLIGFVGSDIFNHVVKGFIALVDELKLAQDFEGIRTAGIHYGQRIGPTVARIVVMVATYGIAKFAGLFKGSMLDLPGGSRAAALAEAQGFSLPAAEHARSVALTTDGAVVIDLGGTAAMSVAGAGVGQPGPEPSPIQQTKPGEFSIVDWRGYPAGLRKPSGPFRVLEGSEYEAARAAANKANAALRAANPEKYAGKQIHEIHPVKFGGSPTDPANKAALSAEEHAQYTTFWNRLMRAIR